MSSKQNLKLLNISNHQEINNVDNGVDVDIKNIISSFSEQKLCDIIVSFRYLGIMETEAILSMEELSRRRDNGSDFLYEQKIDDLLQNLPKIELNLNDIFANFKNIKL